MSIAGPINGQGGLTKAGSGGLDLTAVNSYSGLTTISGGTLQIGNGGSGELLSSSSINDNGTLVFNHADALVYGGPIVGTGNLVKQGPGTLTLTAGNSFSGGTTILGGTLKLVGGVSGFGGSGLGWTVNSSGISSTPITNNVLTLTDNNGAEARSAFYDTPVPVGPFTASFIYQAGGSLGADGVAFVLQNDVHGLAPWASMAAAWVTVELTRVPPFSSTSSTARARRGMSTVQPETTILLRASALLKATPFWPC